MINEETKKIINQREGEREQVRETKLYELTMFVLLFRSIPFGQIVILILQYVRSWGASSRQYSDDDRDSF